MLRYPLQPDRNAQDPTDLVLFPANKFPDQTQFSRIKLILASKLCN